MEPRAPLNEEMRRGESSLHLGDTGASSGTDVNDGFRSFRLGEDVFDLGSVFIWEAQCLGEASRLAFDEADVNLWPGKRVATSFFVCTAWEVANWMLASSQKLYPSLASACQSLAGELLFLGVSLLASPPLSASVV